MNMLLEEWNWDEAKEVWLEEGWEKAEAKYWPVIEESQAVIAEKDREILELRQKLQEMGRG
jgi:hypothetical protein